MDHENVQWVLLIEDDSKIADLVFRGLKRLGYKITLAQDGQEGLEQATSGLFDLIICDLMLPKIDGLTIISKLREKDNRTPVLILSAKSSIEERVDGLHQGADDYLTKPFAFDELHARIEALLRRSQRDSTAPELTVENLRIDLLKSKVFRDQQEIELQQQEYALLVFLAKNEGKIVTRSMIFKQVWEYNVDPLSNVIESRICRLRRKIDDGFDPKLIQTVRGRGYALKTNH